MRRYAIWLFIAFGWLAIFIDAATNGFHLEPAQWTAVFVIAGFMTVVLALVSGYALLAIHPVAFVAIGFLIAYFFA